MDADLVVSIPIGSALDRHDAWRRGRRWRGPPEAVEVEDDTIWMRGEECAWRHTTGSPHYKTRSWKGSRPEEVAMTECSAGPEVRNAATLIGVLGTRVGAVPHGNVLLGAIRRQRWSALNVPLIWVRPARKSLAQCSSG